MNVGNQLSSAFPVGFWNYCAIERQDESAVADWAGLGMTLAMSPEFGPSPDHARRMARILDAAQAKGIAVILCHADGYWRSLTQKGEEAHRRDFAEAAKAFGGHPGVEQAVGYQNWSRYLDEFTAASGVDVPCYDCYSQMSYRCPTEDDFRWQVNTAAAHGAKGLLWYFLYVRTPHENYRVSPVDEHGGAHRDVRLAQPRVPDILENHRPGLAGFDAQLYS